ncbi:hypothetical protein H7827_11995 [Streptomyces sp. JH002]|uniref:Uncharacterized protein n=1 Tax=Streptomyces xiamenensis TaxID=408015 RepID=A0A0F7FWC9_9ACTN|nr:MULTISPECIES: hypothetical protein [Streptomyces]AKG44585.1 hypothetical protein SXIM_32010 [Streptomyces xiamenensis]MCU4747387.1 hypothetical protein [Streptomyces sp. G-5]QQN78014.1 hypothetical protein IPZ77_11600 [Streptomyces sp. XC 2026]
MSVLEHIGAWGLLAGGTMLLVATVMNRTARRGPKIKQGGIAVAAMAIGALVLLNG